jgi:FKBP-type peptidyl-prolyl cis-trans isomerase SlyD
MPLEKGSLIFANYTAKVKDTGEIIDTTSEDEAKRANTYDATRKYVPRLIAVGEGWVIAGLDEQVQKMGVGDKKEIELAPAKAFGERDPSQVRMIPLRKFGEKAGEMTVGDTVEVDNRVGQVRFIGSGRAQVDFNHRLAGKNVTYNFEVVKKVEGEDERVKALIDRRFGGEGSGVAFVKSADGLEVTIPEDLFLTEGLQIIKRGLSTDVFKFVPAVGTVTFLEKYAAKKQEAKSEAKPTEVEPGPAAKEEEADVRKTGPKSAKKEAAPAKS